MDQTSLESKLGDKPLSFYIDPLRRNAVLLTVVCAICAIFLVLHGYVAPARWHARASVIVPTDAPDNPLVGLLIQSSPGLEMIRGVATSESVMDEVAKANEYDPIKLREELSATSVSGPNQVVFGFESTSKKQAIDVLNSLLAILDRKSRDVSFTRASLQAEEYRKSLDAKKNELDLAEKELAVIQSNLELVPEGASSTLATAAYRKAVELLEDEILSLDKQLQSLNEYAAKRSANPEIPSGIIGEVATPSQETLRKLNQLKLELQMKSQSLADGAPEIVRLKREVAAVEATHRQQVNLESEAITTRLDSSVAELAAKKEIAEARLKSAKDRLAMAPTKVIELEHRVREVETLNTVISTLRVQYETALIQARSARITYVLLDPPKILPEPTNKSFGLLGAFGIAVGLTVSILLIFWFKPTRRLAPWKIGVIFAAFAALIFTSYLDLPGIRNPALAAPIFGFLLILLLRAKPERSISEA